MQHKAQTNPICKCVTETKIVTLSGEIANQLQHFAVNFLGAKYTIEYRSFKYLVMIWVVNFLEWMNR